MTTPTEVPTGWDALPVLLETFVHGVVQLVPLALAAGALLAGLVLIASSAAARR